MSDQDQDYLADGDDEHLSVALKEYAGIMAKTDGGAFRDRLDEDVAFYHSIGKAISEMAMLIAAAAVTDDDAEFVKNRRRLLFEARKDDAEIVSLRHYYLANHSNVDLETFLLVSREKFDQRMAEFLADYSQQHPAPVEA